jgi:hypothetical protein
MQKADIAKSIHEQAGISETQAADLLCVVRGGRRELCGRLALHSCLVWSIEDS